jgi:hypothetical protein
MIPGSHVLFLRKVPAGCGAGPPAASRKETDAAVARGGHRAGAFARVAHASPRAWGLTVRAVLATAPVSPQTENEDFAAVTPSAAVLLDGAGTPAGLGTGCIHGIAWYARTLGTVLLARIAAADSGPLADCLHAAIRDVTSRHEDTCDLSHAGSPAATVVATRIRGDELEYLVLSDSVLVLVLASDGANQVVTDHRIETASRPHRGQFEGMPIGTPGRDAAFRQYVQTVRAMKNTDAGYWVASAEPEAADHAICGSVAVSGLRAALLLSDGASRLADVFGLVSWDELVSLVLESGPAELIRQVRLAEASDPDGSRWRRGKAVDDATVVCCDQLAAGFAAPPASAGE